MGLIRTDTNILYGHVLHNLFLIVIMSDMCIFTFKGNLEFFRQLTAPMLQDYTRFGHSITNLGDINGDGLEGGLLMAIVFTLFQLNCTF